MSDARKVFTLQAIGRHVVLELVAAGEQKSAGGIVIPELPVDPRDEARKRAFPLYKGKIISIDPAARLDGVQGYDEKGVPQDLQHPDEGDTVLVRKGDVATYHDPTSGRLYGFVELDKIICIELVAHVSEKIAADLAAAESLKGDVEARK